MAQMNLYKFLLVKSSSNGPPRASLLVAMRLTRTSAQPVRHVFTNGKLSQHWAFLCILATLLFTYTVDRVSGNPHVEHLYYLPIVLAALSFGIRGGVGVAFLSVILYHLANNRLSQFGRSDAIQVALFLSVGMFAAKLFKDARGLHALAMTDDLTGLHNLRSFEAGLARLVRQARRAQAPLSLLVLDVDRLKTMNDRHGHLAGAEAVRTVGSIIGSEVGDQGLACRYGGDEFVIALPGCSPFRANQFARTLCDSVHSCAPLLAGHAFPPGTLSVSIGIASAVFHERPAEVSSALRDEDLSRTLFRSADQSLYHAKSRGRNCVWAS
jgi:diguanylate cyclase (GGDEF)-like protein